MAAGSSSAAKCATPLLGVVRLRSTQIVLGHFLVRDGLDHVRAGDEHVGAALVITMKSVMAGEYTARPRHGPRIALSCGTTPLEETLRRRSSPRSPRETAFLDARAAESLRPRRGHPVLTAGSINLADLLA